MPKYTITDPDSGRKVTISGDSPPNEQELNEIFASLPPIAQQEPIPENIAPAQSAEPQPTLLDRVKSVAMAPVGAAENGVNFVSGMAASPLAGIAGMGSTVLNTGRNMLAGQAPSQAFQGGLASGADTVDSVQGALTYEPRTPFGKTAQSIMQSDYNPLNYLPNAAKYLGDKTNDLTGSPALATAVDTGVNALAIPIGAKAVKSAVPKAVEPVPVAQAAVEAPTYKYSPPTLDTVTPEVKQNILKAKPSIAPEEASRHLEAATLPVPVSLTEGQGLQDAVRISDERNSRAGNERMVQRLGDQNEQLKQNLEVIKTKVAPDVSHLNNVDAGQALVDSLKGKIENDKAQVNDAYKALADANGGKLPVDGKTFANNAISKLREEDRLDYLPPVIAKKLENYAAGGKEMNFNLFENLRTDLAAEMRKAERAGDGTTKYALSKVRDELESLPMTAEAEASGLKELADNARSVAKSVFDKRNSDPAYNVVFDDDAKIGSSSPLADKFLDNYVFRGDKANLEQLRAKIADDPTALQTLSAATIDRLRRSSGIDTRTGSGNLSQAGLNKEITNLSPKLDLLVDPETAQTLQKLGNVARYTQFQKAGSYVNNSNTAVAGAKMLLESVPVVGAPASKLVEAAVTARSRNKALNPVGNPLAGKQKSPLSGSSK